MVKRIRKGVLYLRYSSHSQTEQSIEGQQTECTKYCKKNNIRIVDVYIDRNRSATKNIEKREAFQQMIQDSETGAFDCVVVYALNRFARDRYDSAIYKRILKKNGVDVISATQQISDSPDGQLMETLFEGLDQYYSAELAQKIRRGMNESKKKLQSLGGQTLLGYKIVDKKYVIDEVTAPIVKEAFQRYGAGEGVPSICNDFNKRGFRTSTGNKFARNSLHHIFNNEKYLGTLYGVENGIPAIVDKEEWECVHERLEHNRRLRCNTRSQTEFLLTGKLWCGMCGNSMSGISGKSKTGRLHYYYACTGKTHKKGCTKKNVRKEELERLVLNACVEVLDEPNINRIANMVYDACKEEYATNSKLESLKNQIQSVNMKLTNLMKTLEAGVMSETLIERINDLEDQKAALSKQLAIEESTAVILEPDVIKLYLHHIKDKAEENSEMLIRMLVKAVYLYDDGKVITEFNLTGAKTSTEFVRRSLSSTTLNTKRTLIYLQGSLFFVQVLQY